jgi:hypothetical protein
MTVRCHSAGWPRGDELVGELGQSGVGGTLQEFVEGGDGGAVALPCRPWALSRYHGGVARTAASPTTTGKATARATSPAVVRRPRWRGSR